MSEQGKFVHRSVSLTRATWRRLEELAERDSRSVSYVVRYVVDLGLNENRDGDTRWPKGGGNIDDR